MKKYPIVAPAVALLSALLIVATLSACSGHGTDAGSTSAIYQVAEEISEYVTQNIPSDLMPHLWDGKVSVLVSDNSASITIRVANDYDIPIVAEAVIPLIKTALEDTNTELKSLMLQSYSLDDDGKIDGDTLANWDTEDLDAGVLFSASDGGLINAKASVDDMYEYYAGKESGSKVDVPEDVGETVSEDKTVYITRTGSKYHYDSSCNGGTYYAVKLSEATAKGLTPCAKCVH